MIDVGFSMAGRSALPHSGDASAFPPSGLEPESGPVPDTLPFWVAESAGRPGRAEAPTPERRSGRLRWPVQLGNKTRIAGAVLLLALVLPAVATWAFGRAYRASETDRVDTRLAAALRVAAGSVLAPDAGATRSAQALAQSPAVQRALLRHDGATLAGFAARHGVV